jgi:hypothetical protein
MAKTSTAAVKIDTQTEAAPEAREIPLVKPSHVQLNDAGHSWRNILVRMPEGAVADDLRDPKIWKLVQAVPQSALIRLDRLLILAFDESWIAEALVKHATATEARLLILKVNTFAGVDEKLFGDGTLEVFWDGSSYGVRRIADKQPVSRGHGTEGAAIDALKSYYPKVIR